MQGLGGSCAALVCVLCSCGSDADGGSLAFASYKDGDYVGGIQSTVLEVESTQRVERAEIYLDGQRIASDKLAPFELGWDTRQFAEGAHELAALVELEDGFQLEQAVTISIDNTPPTLEMVPTSIEVGQSFGFRATDNGKLVRVEVSRGIPGEAAMVLTTTPYAFAWSWGCGVVPLEIRAVDAAGGVAVQEVDVSAADHEDADCDLHRAVVAGGDDCDDADPERHPGSTELQDAVDRDCDGSVGVFAGIDADGDGLPSVASGGSDCDDTDASVYGRFLVYEDRRLTAGGQPVQWNAGEMVSTSRGHLFLNRGGTIEQLVNGAQGGVLREVEAHANAGSMAAEGTSMVFGRGREIVLVTVNMDGSTTSRVLFEADARVGRLGYSSFPEGRVVYQAGTQVWIATESDDTWTQQLLVDAEGPLAESPLLSSDIEVPRVAFRTTSSAWTARRSFTDAYDVQRLGPDAVAATAVALHSEAVVATNQGDGSAIYDASTASPVLTLPVHAIRMSYTYPYLYVQTDAPDVRLFDVARGYRPVLGVVGLASLDTAVSMLSIIAPGHVYRLAKGSAPFGANDVSSDGVDKNCDGFDD